MPTRHRHKRRAARFAAIAIAACAITAGTAGSASASPVSEAGEKKAEAEESLKETNERIEEIQARQDELQEQIDSLDAALVQILVDIDTTEYDIGLKQEELNGASAELAEAQEDLDKHFESMSLRIQYMYENGELSVLEALFTSEGFTDVLNRLDMYNAIYSIDREMLDEYTEAKDRVQAIVDEIEEEKNELEDMETSLKEQEAELESEIDARRGEMDDFDARLEEARDLAQQYRETITEMESLMSTVSSPDTVAYSDSGSSSEMGSAVIEYAAQFEGNPYVWGGESLTNGCDCSGFVKQVYAHFGVALPHYSGSMRSVGYAVSTSDMQPGDIVCYEGHVGLYAGNGLLLNASNSKPYPAGGIKYSDVYYKPIICVRRIFA